MFVGNFTADAQLAFYSFTGTCNCPNQNPFVTAQPANAVFSSFTAVNTTCDGQQDVFQAKDINTSNSIDSSQYFTFNITPNSGYNFKLDSLSFLHYAEEFKSGNSWHLASNSDQQQNAFIL